MKQRKQMLCLLLAAVMVGSSLAGCGQSSGGQTGGEAQTQSSVQEEAGAASEAAEEEGNTAESAAAETAGEEAGGRISEETITLTLAGVDDHVGADWNNTVQIQEYENRLGLKFDCTVYNSEQWSTKRTLLFAGDELPDLISSNSSPMSRSDVAKYAQDGYLLDFAPYLDEMPNLKAKMEEFPDLASALYMDDGGIYAFPTSVNSRPNCGLVTRPSYIAGAWLDRLGIEQPKTLDELYEALKAVKEQDANGNGDPDDEIPLVFSNSNNNDLLPILWGFGINTLETGSYYLRAENGKVSLWDTSENYKAYLKYMNRLYTEGLINQDAFVISNEEIDEMGKQDRLFMSGVLGYVMLDSTNLEKQEEMGWYIVPGFTSEYNSEQWYVPGRRVTNVYGTMASADTEHPEELAKFIDYLYSDEGMLSGGNGYEGLTFSFKEVAGTGVADHTGYWEDSYEDQESYRALKAVCGAWFTLGATGKGTIYDMLAGATDEQLAYGGEAFENTPMNAWKETVMRTDGLVVKEQYPLVFYSDDEATEMGTLVTDIRNYLTTMQAKFITGESDIDASWDEYLAQLDQMGLARLMEIEQAAYDRIQ